MRRPFVISLVCLAAACALLLWAFNPVPPAPAPAQTRYALLIQSDTGAFLMQLRKGMQEAAAAQGAQLTVQTLGASPAEQAALLAEEAPSAVLLLLAEPAPMLAALAEAGLPAVVVGQSLPGQVCVASDDRGAGAALMARAQVLAAGGDVLLLADAEDPRAVTRAEGARLEAPCAVLSWTEGMVVPGDYAVYVGASERATRALAQAKAQGTLPARASVLGVDTGETRVRDLESGLVAVLAMDAPYAMGYVALEKAAVLARRGAVPASYACPAPLIDGENMYLHEHVKLVFPLLQ